MFHDVSELLPSPRSRDWSFYLVFFFAVLPVWSSVPMFWFFAGYSLYPASKWLSYNTTGRVLFIISCCEVIFSLYYLHLTCRVSGPPPCGGGDPDEIQVAYTRLLNAGLVDLPEYSSDTETIFVDRAGSPAELMTRLERHDPRAVDFRHSFRTWFRKAPWSSIKLLEMQKWLYWAMYNADLPPLDELPEVHRTVLDDAVRLLEKRLGCKIEEGSNSKVTPMRLTIDRINISWRPLTFYVLIGSINWGLRKFYAMRWNFHYGYSNGLQYLLRIPAQWNPTTSPRPVVFLHGLGLGLVQYHNFMVHLLNEFHDRPILVPLQPQISQDIFHPHFLKPPRRRQFADCLADLLRELGWVAIDEKEDKIYAEFEKDNKIRSSLMENAQRGITLLSHSNGSYTHAWILKCYPEIVGRSCFVDPVTFCLWEGDVCYNFFYRPCMTGMEMIIRYFVGTELGIVNLVQRNFCWTSNSLWFEEVPNARDPHRTLFMLAGKDDIVHSQRVKKYLTSYGTLKNVWYDPEGKHGQALMMAGPGLTEILRWLSEDELKSRQSNGIRNEPCSSA